MFNIGGLFSRMVEILFYVLIGFFMRRKGVFTAETDQTLSKVMIKVSLPALLLSCMINTDMVLNIQEVWRILWIQSAFSIIAVILGLGSSFLFSKDQMEQGNYGYHLSFGNAGILGLAVIQPLFGNDGMFIASIWGIPMNIAMFTVGVRMIQGRRKDGQKLWKQLVTPIPLLAIASILLYLCHIPYPVPVKNTLSLLGSMGLPLLMFTVGSTLATVPSKEYLKLKFGLYLVVKLLIMPVIIWALANYVIPVRDEMLIGILVVIAAMPAAGTGVAMNILYGSREKESSILIFISTMASIVTIPAVVLLLLR